MKHIRQWFVAIAAIMVMLFASCQMGGVSGVTDTSIEEVSNSEKYGNIVINLPDTSRGWDVVQYEVTASRAGEEDVTQTTKGTSLTMRLKVGKWTFIAKGFDSNGILIFRSTAKDSTVSESNSSPITLLLDQQSSAVKYTFSANNLMKSSLTRIRVTAQCGEAGFDSLSGEVGDASQYLTLKGLLTSGAYSVHVDGYIGDKIYATGNLSQAAINDTVNIKNGGAIQLTQTKVTPITSDSVDGASFSSSSAKITLSCATDVAEIRYTTDGTTPTSSSDLYNNGVSIFSGMTEAGSRTLKAIAMTSGMTNSDMFVETYTYNKDVASTPIFSLSAGTYQSNQSITLTSSESNGTIKYKVNNEDWTTYSGAIPITGSTTEDKTYTISAQVTGVTDKTDSAIVSQTYIISYPQLGSVTATPEGGNYEITQYITLTPSVSSAEIYYTTDGSNPNSSSTKKKYTVPFKFEAAGTYTIKAVQKAVGYKDSEVATFNDYIITASQTGGIEITNALGLSHDLSMDTWTNDENQSDAANFTVGTKTFGGSSFTIGETYVMTYPAALSAAITVIKYENKNYTDVTNSCTQVAGSLTFTAEADKYYFQFNITEGLNNVQLSIAKSGTSIPATEISVTPSSASLTVGGEAQEFSVTYIPANANTGKAVTWSLSDTNVASLNGSTVTALAAGSTTLTATLVRDPSKTSTATITVATTTTTTTTIAPVTNTALGEKHPTSGILSPVNQSSWGSTAYTLGANVSGGNTTFALYSANASKVLLEIYDQPYGQDAAYDYWMEKNSSSNQWQAKLSGDLTNKYYAFRVWGPNWNYTSSWKRGNSAAGFSSDYDSTGNRFNPNKVVFDPYAREISHDKSDPVALGTQNGGIYGTGAEKYNGIDRRNFDTGKYAPKAVVINDSSSYGTKPQIPAKDAIVYEAHARGLTRHPSVTSLSSILSSMDGFEGVENIPDQYRGTYKGATYMVKYLKALGINTIELLPVHESDNDGNLDGSAGGNYWAYMTYGYFAPDRRYSYDKTPGGPTKEFKAMVKAFHDEGMEVYLDVVYNHTGEGGPWYGEGTGEHAGDDFKTCEITFMRGIDNKTYYSLCNTSNKGYWETTGCGNNMQCDNAVVRKFVLDSLTYWIDEMGVDGFRFDLAPVLGRVKSGDAWPFSKTAKTLTDVAALGASKNVEMIAEAWDIGYYGDGYQVGQFPSGWGEWNGRFRDSIRNYVGNGVRGALNDYINGDYSNFNDQGGPQRSVNFVVAHDGYTLADLCSGYSVAGSAYNGSSTALQWPFGPSDGGDGSAPGSAFGSTAADKRQANRNYTAIQMISRGVPMIVWGDEFCRTQNGNNNPYNVDSVATWNNYNMINTSRPHAVSTGDTTGGTMAYHNNFGKFDNDNNVNGNFKFMQYMLNLRKNEPALRQDSYNVSYTFKKENGTVDLEDGDRCVWIRIGGSSVTDGHDYLVFMNMYTAEVSFSIPAAKNGYHWTRVVDTANWAEQNYNVWADSDTICTYKTADAYGVNPWAVVIMKEVSDTATCATPVISGTDNFTTNSTISISCGTTGASIYYTTDGSTPSKTNGTLYTSSFTISKTTTVKAIAIKTGNNNSTVATVVFTKDIPTCATPVISGTTPFESTTTVSISCGTASASIYYTTDGSTPSTTNGTLYSSSFTLSAGATVKAIAVKNDMNDSAVATERFVKQGEMTAENPSGVMLQGFTWNSAPRGEYGVYSEQNPSPNWGKWYQAMINRAADIKDTFEYVWCPPPSKTDTASSEGYAPTQLNDLNNCYGTATELANMINAIKPAKAIADIVINHRAGTTSWGDFTNPSWCDDYYAICSDDEGFSNSNSPMHGSSKKGAPDTGDGYSAYRDLDHTNTAVQNGIITWMNSVLKAAGFVGWRYDYVKGYGAQYVGKYNKETDAVFSVGEYWPSAGYNAANPSLWGNEIKNWVNGTETNGGQRSKAFDFALKGALNDVFGYYYTNNNVQTYNSGSFNFARLADSANLYISQPADAVTFVDNHDTGSNQGHWGLKNEYIGAAYSLILTHPGFPCVAWSHYFTFAESGISNTTYPYSGIAAAGTYIGSSAVSGSSKSYSLRQHIDYLIGLRKELGIEYNSERTTIEATSAHYVAQINGTKGSLIVEIGSGWSKPSSYSDYDMVYFGDNFCIYTSDSSKCSAPVITFNNGTCTITCSTQGATIKYKKGSGSYQTYSSPFSVSDGQTVTAYAQATGLDNSSTVSKTYSIITTVTLSCTSDVGSGNGVYFLGAFEESATWTIAVRGNWTNGNVWVAEVTPPASGTFEWKAVKATYVESNTAALSSLTNVVWQVDPNNSYPTTSSITYGF